MEKFDELLKLGADIHVRNHFGETCLHLCLQASGGTDNTVGSRLWVIREYEALKFLVQRGADPHATDYDGQTVSDIAYTMSGWSHLGSYHGDLWDSVLQSCGYNITEFRLVHLREAKYAGEYTRWHFEQLWKGRECFCPFWDDRPWPPLGSGDGSKLI